MEAQSIYVFFSSSTFLSEIWGTVRNPEFPPQTSFIINSISIDVNFWQKNPDFR